MTFAYEFTVPRAAWNWDAESIEPFLIRCAQEKAGTTEGEWTVVGAFLDIAVMADGLDPVYRVCVEGQVP